MVALKRQPSSTPGVAESPLPSTQSSAAELTPLSLWNSWDLIPSHSSGEKINAFLLLTTETRIANFLTISIVSNCLPKMMPPRLPISVLASVSSNWYNNFDLNLTQMRCALSGRHRFNWFCFKSFGKELNSMVDACNAKLQAWVYAVIRCRWKSKRSLEINNGELLTTDESTSTMLYVRSIEWGLKARLFLVPIHSFH